VVDDQITAGEDELPFDPPLAPVAADRDEANPPAAGSAIDGLAVSTVARSGRAHLVYVSETLAALLGYEPHQLLGREPGVVIHPRTPAAQLDAVADIVDAGSQAVVRLALAHADGTAVEVQATYLAVPTAGGPPAYLSLYRQLGGGSPLERVLAAQALALDRVAKGGDLQDVVRHVVERVEHLAGAGRAWFALVERAGGVKPLLWGDHDPETVAAALEAAWGSRWRRQVVTVRVDELPEEVAGPLRDRDVHALWLVPVGGADGRPSGLLAVARPDHSAPTADQRQLLAHLARVTSVAVQRSQSEASLAHQVLHDPLTQLPNRALIMDRLEQAIARLGRDRTTLAVLLVDIDRFKAINDTRGPLTGDRVLVEVSRRLRRSVRLGDTVGRLAGDQFLAVCVAVDFEHDVATMAERVIEMVSAPITVDGTEIRLTASAGVVLVDRPGRSAAAVISSAESALRQAVEAGRGRWAIYNEGLQRRVVVRHEVEQALHVALTDDELLLHYQPLVELRTGHMVGVEALIRWERPGHGLLAPGAFIDIAEETGLIVPLGRWAIDEACRHLAAWPADERGRRPFITVNLSARQLCDEDLVGTVVAALDRHRLEPESLGFEVTESVRVDDVESAWTSLRRLSDLGCRLAIDDFGIGYATLDHLRRFSMAHALKIDRSFVAGLGCSREDTAIVSASVALAKSLGLLVVGEGVESYDQLAELRALGVDQAQGYVISPPVPIERAHELWHIGQLVLGSSPWVPPGGGL
jgi:diguanylate cyclase (GGDEF)-like protein